MHIVNGIVTTNRQSGAVLIDLFTNRLQSGDGSIDPQGEDSNVIKYGYSGSCKGFKSISKTVSIRWARLYDTTGGGGHSEGWNINDRIIDKRNLEISWETAGSAELKEISYMVIAEVDDGAHAH
ncbi:MAG: hypothetical protein HY751_04315 [Nitrospinae bacterium]|nr:hypothetical protein [Nitrospinota bacterium]